MRRNRTHISILIVFLYLLVSTLVSSQISNAQSIPVTPTNTLTYPTTNTPTGTPPPIPPTLLPTDTEELPTLTPTEMWIATQTDSVTPFPTPPTLPATVTLETPTPTSTPTSSHPTPIPPTLLPTDTAESLPATDTPTQTPIFISPTLSATHTTETPTPTGTPPPISPTLLPTNTPIIWSHDTLQDALFTESEKKQAIQFNPDAALQKRIFLDRFVPNSPEIKIKDGNTIYAAQRAENLTSGKVRVYYVAVGDWDNVHFVEPAVTGINAIEQLLIAEVEKRQAIQFNPSAALQKRVFADGFVPNSPEFYLQYRGTIYIAQRTENLKTGLVRVYFVQQGDWSSVQFVDRIKSNESEL